MEFENSRGEIGTGVGEILVKGKEWDDGAAESRGRKRKRGLEEVAGLLDPDMKLPSTWDVKTRRSGSAAVVVFVDKASVEMVLREGRRVGRKGRGLVWRGERLGEERGCFGRYVFSTCGES